MTESLEVTDGSEKDASNVEPTLSKSKFTYRHLTVILSSVCSSKIWS